MPIESAGLLLYRKNPRLEVFLAHPGGPFWQHKDLGVWTIPKGEIEPGEEPMEAALREFQEETSIVPIPPFHPLGTIQQKSGKIVHCWAWEGDVDPRTIRSNMMKMIWPPNSGRWITVPEIDRCAWFPVREARRRIIGGQRELLDRLVEGLGEEI